VELGFDTRRVLAATVRLPEARYGDQAARAAFFEDLERRVAAIPGVEAAAYANEFPMRGGWSSGFTVDGESGERRSADFQAVSRGYFGTLAIPLVRGRLFDAGDRATAAPVAVVSDAFGRRFLGGRDPIGHRLRRGPRAPEITIVGVVGDVRRDGRQAELQPQVYLAAAQTDLYPVRLGALAVRAAGDPRALAAAVQRAVWAIDPDQPVSNVRTLDEIVDALAAGRRFNMTLLALLAALALGLAIVGVYAVVSFGAGQRTREIGVRMALGATRSDVIRMIVGHGMGWAAWGVAAGMGLALAATRGMRGLLFGIEATDPPTFVAVAVAMLAVAGLASYLPARRAANADPVRALRAV
jgi:predicted permease